MSRVSRYAWLGSVAIAAAVLGALAARYSMAPEPPEHALLLDTPRELPDFNLVDHHGGAFAPSDLSGRWNFLFFGFTHCPDVCPTTLFTLARVLDQLENLPEQDRPGVIMVSVDPTRDTPDILATYVPYFHADFLGVTGDMPEILALTRAMGVAFSYTPRDDDEDNYSVDHTASIFLLDPAGRLAAIFGTPHATDQIARDYRRITEARG